MLKRFKDFINEARVVSFDNENEGNFVVVVGGAGSGKSFISSNLLNLRDFKHISVDTFREMIAKKLGLDLGNPKHNIQVLKMTGGSSDPKNPTIKNIKNILGAREHLPNIIFDAGGSQKDIIKTIAEMAENIGYTTTLVYVKADLDVALQRNLERERVLDPQSVKKHHAFVNKNIPYFIKQFKNAWIVDNSEDWDFSNRPTDRIIKVKG